MEKNNSNRNNQTPNPAKPENTEKRLKHFKELEKLGVKDITKELEGTFYIQITMRKNKL